MYSYDFPSWLLYMSDVRRCKELLKDGSRSFYFASLVLPKTYRQPITAIYAFCRVTDDEIDQHGATDKVLAALHTRLDRIYDGHPENRAVDRAFADVVRRYNLPKAVPAALLEGFAWDIGNRSYETMSDLYAYGARVASSVGTMLAVVMGIRDPSILSRACDLGVAMQITNIARDVGEDAAAGRLYLPRQLLRAQGVDPDAWLRNPVYTPAIGNVVQEILEAAAMLYRRADWGLTELPAGCRPAMFSASSIYEEIGAEVAASGFDSVSRRAVVPGSRKLLLLGRAIRNAVRRRDPDSAPTLAETKFLVDAVSRA